MPDFDFSVIAALDQLATDIPLPARYDDLTADQRRRVREQYACIQKGRCHYCHAPLGGPPTSEVQRKHLKATYPPNFFEWPQHLHHSHVTGLTIGTVHARCNAVLWEYHGE